MDWLLNNFAETLVVIGLLLLVVEVAVLGFATFFLFFVGLALITTGGLMWIGLIPEKWLQAIGGTAFFSAVFALAFWQKLKGLQNSTESTTSTNDLIGTVFVLSADIDQHEQTVTQQFSGITWQLRANQPILAGTAVKIVSTEVGILTIEPA